MNTRSHASPRFGAFCTTLAGLMALGYWRLLEQLTYLDIPEDWPMNMVALPMTAISASGGVRLDQPDHTARR